MRNRRGGLIGLSVKMHIAPSGGATAAAECRVRGREERMKDRGDHRRKLPPLSPSRAPSLRLRRHRKRDA